MKAESRTEMGNRLRVVNSRGCWLPFILFAPFLLLLSVKAMSQGAKQSRQSSPPSFEKIAAEADRARETGELGEAITLYQRCVRLKPRWDQGWWYLATLLYEGDRYAEAVLAFQRVVALRPQIGPPLGMLGLCEYRLGHYDDAFLHLRQARQRSLSQNPDLARIIQYHEGTIFTLRGEFEVAQQIFIGMSRAGTNNQEFILAVGLAVLRISALPRDIESNHIDRELVRRAGLAQHYFSQLNFADARIEFERLVADFPKSPNVFYAYGRFLVDSRDFDEGIVAFEREIANSPTHALARLQIAYIKIRNKDAEAAIPLAEEAVRLNTRLPLAHYILGRSLFETGQNDRAIEELEVAQKLAPLEPRVYYSLARAYAKANRKEKSEQARETFARLSKEKEEAAKRGELYANAFDEREATEKTKP